MDKNKDNIFSDKLIFLNHFSRLCRSLEECITVCDNGTLLYRPYQPMIQN